jgi:NAD(P)-dependent dehydrogenase (short-subunit alcohol dehydrogenase family)
MKFHQSHLDLFSRVSGDTNPIHLDLEYARRSQLSRPIVFGMSLVLQALAQWAGGRSFSLQSLKGEFRQPVFPDQDYKLEIVERGSNVRARYHFENVLAAEVEWTWEPHAREEWPDLPAYFSEDRYAPDPTALAELLDLYGLSKSQMPWHQLCAVFWSSYFVGMKNPGTQALYSGFEFDFDKTSPSPYTTLHSLSASEDDRFRLTTIQGKGDGIREFSLQAFRRPEPIHYLDHKIQTAGESALAGKSVFISGAGRGFGAVLARTFGHANADVFLNYQFSENEAARAAQSLNQIGIRCWPIQGDVSNLEDCQRMSAFIQSKTGGLDILVNNAALKAKPFPGEFSFDNVEKNLAMAATPTKSFASIMKPHALVVFISSLYVKRPEAGFEDYVESKRKIEEFAREWAQNRGNMSVIVARPPRMRIQQGFALEAQPDAASPVHIASELVKKIAHLGGDGSFYEWDFA